MMKNNPFVFQSILVHLLILSPFLASIGIKNISKPQEKTISRVKLVDKPPKKIKKVEPKKTVEIKKQIDKPKSPPKPKPKKVKKVFGASKKSITSKKAKKAIAVKAGNTVAKAPDKEILKKEDEELPTPTEEFLVSEMPELKSEVIIPYPQEAKKTRS